MSNTAWSNFIHSFCTWGNTFAKHWKEKELGSYSYTSFPELGTLDLKCSGRSTLRGRKGKREARGWAGNMGFFPSSRNYLWHTHTHHALKRRNGVVRTKLKEQCSQGCSWKEDEPLPLTADGLLILQMLLDSLLSHHKGVAQLMRWHFLRMDLNQSKW